MVFVAFTMVVVSGTLVWETKTMVSKPETVFLVTGKMVSLVKKIFSITKTMVYRIETMVRVMNTIFTTRETMVAMVRKMVSVAPTMVCVIETSVIGPSISGQSFANPKLVSFWSL